MATADVSGIPHGLSRFTGAINAGVLQQNIARNGLIFPRNVGPLCRPVRCGGTNESPLVGFEITV